MGWALAHPTGPVVVRASSAADLAAVSTLAGERVVAIEVPLELADAAWPEGVPLDVLVRDPAREAAGLYALSPVARRRPVRVTVTARPGVARAARIAMALQLPVRVLSVQPAADVIGELGEVLDEYLHGPRTSAPVEFFQSALARWLHGDAPPAWVVLELDPDWHPRVADEGDTGEAWPMLEPGFVQAHLERLESQGAECGACRFRDWCQGFFKWPDPAYHCAPGVMPLLSRIEESAKQLARDLDQFQPDSR